MPPMWWGKHIVTAPGTEMAVEMLTKVGINYRTQENGEKYPRLSEIIEN